MSFNKLRAALKHFHLDSIPEHLAIWNAIRQHKTRNVAFSQDGEDQFLSDYFSGKVNGFYIEIGANNPVILNSTYSLYRMGWSGIAVDPIRRFQKLFSQYRPRDIFIHAAAGTSTDTLEFNEMIPDVFSTFDSDQARLLEKAGAILWKKYQVEVRPLQSIIRDANRSEIDFMSIDAEGFDHDVLTSNDWNRFRPRLISCEVDKWENHGDYFKSISYREIHRVRYNSFYESL